MSVDDAAADRRVGSRFLMARWSVSDRTIDRWLGDRRLNFPVPMRVNGRRFWLLSEILKWERQRAQRDSGEAA
jgi:predicted DNA-binding transcriptional regulator AlpA